MTTRVLAIGCDDPRALDPRVVGNKGAGLQRMHRLGVPVPPGFTVIVDAGHAVRRDKRGDLDDALSAEIEAALAALETQTGRTLGGDEPLLVSVRSGAAASMPGMMDTVLNLGMTDAVQAALAAESGDARFAADVRRRFTQMYGHVVLGVPQRAFEREISARKRALGRPMMRDAELETNDLNILRADFEREIAAHDGDAIPASPRAQLRAAIAAVFRSWNNPRAVRFRRLEGIDDAMGTACTVQAMVFGNLGGQSGSGVLFSRNPTTGEPGIYGEFLDHAQGEDVVAGIRTPSSLTAANARPGQEDLTLERAAPETFRELSSIAQRLETACADIQDIEFTVERGKVFVLQTRSARRSAAAAVRFAVDAEAEGLLDRDAALLSIEPAALPSLLKAALPGPEVLASRGVRPFASGLPASPGAVTGRLSFSPDDARRRATEGQDVILVRRDTAAEDIHGMKAAVGIWTSAGGMTSHAAVVARGLGKCCVVGCHAIEVDTRKGTLRGKDADGQPVVLRAGDIVTLDGQRGKVYLGALEVEAAASVPELDTVLAWADARRRMKVRANADHARAVRTAVSYGAEGVGLCRTEHMFLAGDRLLAVRCLLLAEDEDEQEEWLDRVTPLWEEDFTALLAAADGRPVAVRLLDWPLHEFWPRDEHELAATAEALGVPERIVHRRIDALREVNPMLGYRGARVALTRPGLARAQAKALYSAAATVAGQGLAVSCEVMVPVVSAAGELRVLRAEIEEAGRAVLRERVADVPIRVGCLIEVPRACLVADDLAKHADFLSFGTNDLTQTTFGISREDAGRFIPHYVQELGILTHDPFARLDARGVGELIALACERGRDVAPSMTFGMCGEHGGDPAAIRHCESLEMDYVSCPPDRVPVARLAAAQAAILRARAEKDAISSN